jgi:hydroxypyruvate isomerase
MAALPGREKEFMAGLDRTLEFALATGCKRLHAMAGNWPAGANWREGAAVYVDNLRGAADRVAAHGITVLIEPLNKRDNPGYFLNTTAEAAAILKEVGRNNVNNLPTTFEQRARLRNGPDRRRNCLLRRAGRGRNRPCG